MRMGMRYMRFGAIRCNAPLSSHVLRVTSRSVARYLETEREVTRKTCEDSGALQRIAPNLMYRIPILIPVLREEPSIHLEMVEKIGRASCRERGVHVGGCSIK